MLDRVTVTGADDKTDIADMLKISRDYPFVEWGILFSTSKEGVGRFPDREWVQKLLRAKHRLAISSNHNLDLSAHICGKMVREIFYKGDWSRLFKYYPPLPTAANFERMQLNFSPYLKKSNVDQFILGLTIDNDVTESSKQQLIFQVKGFHEPVIDACKSAGVNCAPLLDRSGGRGLEVSVCGQNPPDGYYGCAGGLNAGNIKRVLGALQAMACSISVRKYWIDVESGVRTDNEFDLEKVREFLSICSDYIVSA